MTATIALPTSKALNFQDLIVATRFSVRAAEISYAQPENHLKMIDYQKLACRFLPGVVRGQSADFQPNQFNQSLAGSPKPCADLRYR